MLIFIGWIASLLSILGAIFNARKSIIGFWLWIVANFIWLIVSLIRKDYAQVILWITYIITSSYGIYCWSKEKKNG